MTKKLQEIAKLYPRGVFYWDRYNENNMSPRRVKLLGVKGAFSQLFDSSYNQLPYEKYGFDLSTIPYQRPSSGKTAYRLFGKPKSSLLDDTFYRWKPKDSDNLMIAYGEHFNSMCHCLFVMIKRRASAYVGRNPDARYWDTFKIFDFTGTLQEPIGNIVDKVTRVNLKTYWKAAYRYFTDEPAVVLSALDRFIDDVLTLVKTSKISTANMVDTICVFNFSYTQLIRITQDKQLFAKLSRLLHKGWQVKITVLLTVDKVDKDLLKQLNMDAGFYLGQDNSNAIKMATGKLEQEHKQTFIGVLRQDFIGLKETSYSNMLYPVLPPVYTLNKKGKAYSQTAKEEEELYMQYLNTLDDGGNDE